MRFTLNYPDRYTEVNREHEFFAPDLKKAKEHADSLCERRAVSYSLMLENGEIWQREYSVDRNQYFDWIQSAKAEILSPMRLYHV